jgi:hypothetical protein
MTGRTGFPIAWLLAYAAVIAVAVAGAFYGRHLALEVYGSAEAQAEWDAWRAGAEQLAEGAGPVKRRVPKSAEPPALVLMRDHFAVCLGGAVVLSTILFGTFMLLARGAMQTAPPRATSWKLPAHRDQFGPG